MTFTVYNVSSQYMGWNDHVDWDKEAREAARKIKIEKATKMKKQGYDEEDINAIFHTSLSMCEGECDDFLTFEEEEAGWGMCMPCKFDAMK